MNKDKRAPEIVVRIWVEDSSAEWELRGMLRMLLDSFRLNHRGVHFHIKKAEKREKNR